MANLEHDKSVIELAKGNPITSKLPVDIFKKATELWAAKSNATYNLQYADEDGPIEFRQHLSEFLNHNYSNQTRTMPLKVLPEELCVVAGAAHGLDMVCKHFSSPGDYAIVEDPTYFLALDSIKGDYRLNVVQMPIDNEGLIIDDNLIQWCVQYKPKFIYTVPTHHNPTGVTMSHERRKKLVEFADKHNILIVADEVYQLLSYNGFIPPPSLVAYDNKNVISIGSFSKILSPGLRLGWLHTKNKEYIMKFLNGGLFQSGGGLNYIPGIVTCMIETGLLQENLEKSIAFNGHNLSVLADALQKQIPELEFSKPTGGYFIWAKLPAHIDVMNFHELSKAHGVSIQKGDKGQIVHTRANYIRLCFTIQEPPILIEAASRLRKLLDVLQQK
jgi:DNA-binding transcriptional MocR family regulator